MKKLALLFLLSGFVLSTAQAATKTFNAVTVEIEGTKIWLPSSFTVNQGDDVEIKLQTKVPAPNNVHGFTIDDYKVVETVDENQKTIKFKANKAGIFPIRCHLHPAHIGGQLVVLKK